MASDTDRIEKRIQLKASRSRVWRAVTDAKEFGTWFRCAFEGTFEPGKTARGKILYPGYEHLTISIDIERMEPESVFSFRWHPHATDPKVDYSHEPKTLCEFRLEDKDGGTLLTLTESGFDGIPAERRATAFRANGGGWEEQMKNIEKHLADDAA